MLYQLRNLDCCYSVFPNNIDYYLNLLLHDQPNYILGMGTYSGVDQDKIRIETLCTNKFRNDILYGNEYVEKKIDPYLEVSESMKFASGIGNSYCNLVSWKITELIDKGKLKAKYTFLHIPKNIKPWILVPEIDKALTGFSVSNI